MTRSLPIALALTSLACLPSPAPVEWQALDMQALREQVANPSAELTDASVEQAAAVIVADLDAFRTITSFLVRQLLAPLAPDTGAEWVLPQALNGTSVYAMLACPGEDIDAQDVGFAYGWLRLDSPTLTQEVIESRSFGGDLQLSFEACQIGQFRFDGPVPAHFDEQQPELGLAMQVAYVEHVEQLDGNEREGLLDLRLLADTEGVSVVITLESGQTLTLELSPSMLSLGLFGSNGALLCEVVEYHFECSLP